MKNIIWSTGHIRKLDDIVEAKNCYIQDSKGNRYIDLESGVWATSLGHCNARVNSILQSQINKIIHSGFNYCHPVIKKQQKIFWELLISQEVNVNFYALEVRRLNMR